MDPQNTIIEPTNKSHRMIFIVITILLTAGVVGGSVYYIMSDKVTDGGCGKSDSSILATCIPVSALKKMEQDKEDQGVTENKIEVEEKKTEAVTGVRYTNSQYGFFLKFPDGWKDYSITEEAIEGSVKVIYFGLPLKEEFKTADGFNKYYFSPFAITVQTKKQWEDLQNGEEMDKGTKLGENGTYVFSYSTGNGTAETKYDIDKAYGDVKEIVKTFKIAE